MTAFRLLADAVAERVRIAAKRRDRDMTDPASTLFVPPEMAVIWSGESHVREMLAFEAALARAEARAGVIPAEAAAAIEATCHVDGFDVPALYREAATAGTPAIPLVRMLTARVEGEARGFVHWGATSQDAIDTALVLQMRAGLDLLVGRLFTIGEICAQLATRHRDTIMPGRTLLQEALPITFGLKAARWLALATRQIERLGETRGRISVVQFGGAAGTLASLGEAGPHVTELLAEELGLGVPELPWHTERDRVADVAAALGILAGAMAKIAEDIVLLAQSEAGEVAEAAGPGKGGSSAMPQKRNPVNATMALAGARLAIGLVPVALGAMTQEHERAAGGWQAEWQALPDLFRYTAGTVERVRDALDGLEVHTGRMAGNLARSGGQMLAEALTMALAPRLGRHEAYRITREVSEHATSAGEDMRQVALGDERVRAVLSPDQINDVFDPSRYLGSANIYIEQALARFHTLQSSQGDSA